MREVVVSGLFILLFDAVLCSALWAGLVLLKCSSCGGLAGVWAFGALKWAILCVFTSVLTDGKPQGELSRLVALLCLLSPVIETGRILVVPPSELYMGPPLDFSMLLLGLVSSSLACVVWEKGLCAGKIKKDNSKQNTKQLLLRVLKYFRPDSLYLIAAFSFLILGVFCKCEESIFYSIFQTLHIFSHCCLLNSWCTFPLTGDTYIPLYQGRVIDMLRGQVLQTSFYYAIGQLALVSLGR